MARPDRAWIAVALLLGSCAAASARTAQIDNKLNLRHGPGQEHRVIVVMPAGANVSVGEWCKVEYRGQRGYANSALLSGGDAALAAAPAAAPAAASTKYDANDEVRVLNWNDREWRDRYWREMDLRKRRWADLGLAEHPLVNRIDVLEVMLEVEVRFDVLRLQRLSHLRVGFEQRQKVIAIAPNLASRSSARSGRRPRATRRPWSARSARAVNGQARRGGRDSSACSSDRPRACRSRRPAG